MSNTVESCQLIWRAKKSKGPDVEMIVHLPVAVAVESKNTLGDALGDFDQVISYKRSRKYDATILRIERCIEKEGEKLEQLLKLASTHGVGVVVGGHRYSPLMGGERVLLQAPLHLTSDPVEVLRRSGSATQILRMPLDKLLIFRRYFKASGYG